MKNLLALVFILLFTSCVTEKGATHFFVNKHPEKLAQLCVAQFPVKETFRPGVPVILRDTIKGDSIQCPPPAVNPTTGQSIPAKVKCPDSTHEKEIIRDTVFRENTAKTAFLESQVKSELTAKIKAQTELNKLSRDYTKLSKDYEALLIAIGVLSVAASVLLFLLLRK